MDEKRATTILLLIVGAVFVYSVFQYDSFGGSGEAVAPVSRQPSNAAVLGSSSGSYAANTSNTTNTTYGRIPPVAVPTKRVFVTNTTYFGNMGGLGGWGGAANACYFAAWYG